MSKNLLYAINDIEDNNVDLIHTFDKSTVIEFIIEGIETYIRKILYYECVETYGKDNSSFEENNNILNKLEKLINSLKNSKIDNYDFKTYTDDRDGYLMIDIHNDIIDFELHIFGLTNIVKHVTTVNINKL